ncbi:hypothetical protein JB92DRAFT_801553 [Gautieria morchelliformis]|nr:hypothetical protein JB92DRAFT_801553 [Gautieria morchelliformis]
MLRTITLVFALSLILTVAAHSDTPLSRRHAPAVNRMIKKRAGLISIIDNAAAPQDPAQQASANVAATSASPTSNTDTVTPANTQSSVNPQPTAKSATTNSVATQTTSASAQSSSASTAIIPSILNSVLPQSANSTTSSSSSTSSTSTSSSSTSLTLSSSSSTPSSTQSSTPTAAPQSQTGGGAITLTTTTPAASATASPASASGSVTKLQRNTIIILVAIGASIGAAGIIWTIIRKWKFRPSSSFEDRMQPIDWQPTTEPHEDRDMTERLSRNGSTRSHGSFTSGNNHGSNHDNLTVDLPPHDFTPGAAHLAPVGGYADLQRGPSPQPDLHRGPSFRTPGDYQYEIPNPHGQYYAGAGAGMGAGVGAYQGGYDAHRGY